MTSTHQSQAYLSDLPFLIKTEADTDLNLATAEVLKTCFAITPDLHNHPDIHWINLEATLKIEDVRQLQAISSYKPYQLAWSFFIISNLDTASLPAQNALLKILEEPPEHVKLILFCQQSELVIGTVASRCQQFLLNTNQSSLISDSEKGNSLYDQILQSNYGQLVELAETIADKAAAEKLVVTLLNDLHSLLTTHLQSQIRLQYVKQIHVLQQTLNWLKANVNYRLALEECFFKIKNLSSKP